MKIFSLILLLIACLGLRNASSQTPSPEAASTPAAAESPSASPAVSPAATTTVSSEVTTTTVSSEAASSPAASPAAEVAASPADASASPAVAGVEAPVSPETSEVLPTATDALPPPDTTELPSAPSTEADAAASPAAEGPKTDQAMPDAAFTEPSSFVPETVTETTTTTTTTTVRENEAEKSRQEVLRYRKAKTIALKDADIRNMLEQAEFAKTDEDRRAAFRKYYDMLEKKIAKVDPTITDYAKMMKGHQLYRLKQDNMEPTIPLNPPPTPQPNR